MLRDRFAAETEDAERVKARLVAMLLGAGVLAALLRGVDLSGTAREIVEAGWSLPAITLWGVCQLFVCACAWRAVVGERRAGRLAFLRLRLIREAVNAFLPVAQIGGPIAGVLEMRRLGVGIASAGAGTIVDVAVETGALFVFALVGLGLAGAAGVSVGPVLSSVLGAFAAAVTIVVFAGLRRDAALRFARRALAPLMRLAPKTARTARAVHLGLLQVRRRPHAVAKAAALHLAAWSMGAGEAWLVLAAMHVPVGFAAAFVVESLTAAARGAGFAIPGVLGVQEAGLMLSAGLFGVSPEAAIALSMVKRMREVLIGIAGLGIWQIPAIREWLGLVSPLRPGIATGE